MQNPDKLPMWLGIFVVLAFTAAVSMKFNVERSAAKTFPLIAAGK